MRRAKPGLDELVQLLPRRERETLVLLLQGDGEKQVARQLAISRHTVHVYVKALYRKFEVNTRSELLSRFLVTALVSLMRSTPTSVPPRPRPRRAASPVRVASARQRRISTD